MADNIQVNEPVTLGKIVATQDVGGVQHEKVIIEFDDGAGGVTKVSAANPLPVTYSGGGGGAVTIVDGGDIAEGSTTDAAIVTDANGTVSGKLRGVVKLISSWIGTLGQKTMANSASVTIASDQSAIPISGSVTTGGLTDTQLRATPVPVTGTLFGGAVTIADGADVTEGAIADAIVAAGAAGTVSAKLRRTTQGIEDLKTGIVLAAGANVIGHVINDASSAVIGHVINDAGAAIIGKVGIDQTTPGTTNGVVVNSSALPSGGSTAANQSTEIASLASIDAGIPAALGQTTMANSMPVVLPSNQSAIPVTGTLSPTADIAPATQNITVIDTGSSTTTGANNQSIVIGTPTVGSAASFAISGIETVRVEVTGIWTGTIIAEQSIDGGITWVSQGLHQGAYTTASFIAGFVAGGNVAGGTNFRMRATTAITGTVVVKIIESINTQSVYIANAAPSGTVISVLNSTTATLGSNGVYTGTGEDVTNFSEMRISVISNQASAADGLSIQQSPDNSNWDITDTYTIAAATAKTFVVPRQARFFRIVYTNGSSAQGSFRLQSILNRTATAPSSQRATDAYSNETDLVQNQVFPMGFNGATWDRLRATIANGLAVDVTRVTGNVTAVQATAANLKAQIASTQKPSYGATVVLAVTALQSLTSSATVGWKSVRTSNLATLATDYEIMISLTTANTAPANDKAMYLYVIPWYTSDAGTTWFAASGGTATLPTSADATYTIASPNNFRLLGVLNYTTAQMVCQDVFLLSNCFGNRMPDGFSFCVINFSGATLSTGCILDITPINDILV